MTLYKIKHSALVEFQHKLTAWPPFPGADVSFEVKEVPPALGSHSDGITLLSCRAFGFGQLGQGDMAYGNGPVLVRGWESLYECN